MDLFGHDDMVYHNTQPSPTKHHKELVWTIPKWVVFHCFIHIMRLYQIYSHCYMIFPISCWLCVGCLSSTGWTTDSDACSIIDLAVLWFWHWLPDCRVCESWRVHAYTSFDLTGTPEKYRTHNYSTLSYRTRNYRTELVKVKKMVDNAIMEHNRSPTRIIEKK